MPLLATRTVPPGEPGGRWRAAGVDLEGGQVAGVHPDQGRPGVGGHRRLGHGVDLDQGVQAGLGGLVQQGAERGRVEGGHDQQDRVGPPKRRASHTW